MPGSVMASPSPKIVHQFGITAALSLSGPSGIDLARNRDLEKFLAQAGLLESQEQSILRERVLGQLGKIMKLWVRKICAFKGYKGQLLELANAKLLTFGSYRLGVHSPEADIDALCIGPCYATRKEDFFVVLHSMLLAMHEVTELHAVPEAHVPVLKFKFNGISIDLLYARLAMWIIPEVTGFLGGISWALLVAQICQLYPNAIPSMLVSRFFRVYTQWRWPNPVMLCKIEKGSLHLAVWDARKNPKDRTHVMPIITPSYPCTNSSYNVSLSTLKVLMEQFKFGSEVCQAVDLRHAEWSLLFEDYPFFSAYKNYLQIDVVAFCEDDFRLWKGWVESRLRQLTLKIERDTFGIVHCHLHPSSYVDSAKSLHHTAFFMGLSCSQEGKEFDLHKTVEEFKRFICSAFHQKLGMDICVSHVRRKQIPLFVFQECDQSSSRQRFGNKASQLSKFEGCKKGEEGNVSGQIFEGSQGSLLTLHKRQKVGTSLRDISSHHGVSRENTDNFKACEIMKHFDRREGTRGLPASNHPLNDDFTGSKMQEREFGRVFTASKKHNTNSPCERWLERGPRSKAQGFALPAMGQAIFGLPFGQPTKGDSSCGTAVPVIAVNGRYLERGSHSDDVQAAMDSYATFQQRAKMAIEIGST